MWLYRVGFTGEDLYEKIIKETKMSRDFFSTISAWFSEWSERKKEA